MNIYIDKLEHEFLYNRILQQHLMGSYLYGTNNENSDKDYLCVYKDLDLVNLPKFKCFPNFHQFQYKDIENNIDWIYCSETQFWKNLYSGDATINSDIVLFSGEFLTPLKHCRTYKIIKAYLGFTKRDLKQINRNNFKKKISHIKRGLYTADCLLLNIVPDLQTIQYYYKSISDDYEYEKISIQGLKSKESLLRNELNSLYEKDEIKNYPIIQFTHNLVSENKIEQELCEKLIRSNNIKEFKY